MLRRLTGADYLITDFKFGEILTLSYTWSLNRAPLLGGTIGVRAGEARGAAAAPKFWATQIFWEAREILGKTSFLRRFRVF